MKLKHYISYIYVVILVYVVLLTTYSPVSVEQQVMLSDLLFNGVSVWMNLSVGKT